MSFPRFINQYYKTGKETVQFGKNMNENNRNIRFIAFVWGWLGIGLVYLVYRLRQDDAKDALIAAHNALKGEV